MTVLQMQLGSSVDLINSYAAAFDQNGGQWEMSLLSLADRIEAHYKRLFSGYRENQAPIVPSSDQLDNTPLPWLVPFSVLVLLGPLSRFLNLLP